MGIIISLLSIFSGMILFSFGVIGEYFWRMMENIKKPRHMLLTKSFKLIIAKTNNLLQTLILFVS